MSYRIHITQVAEQDMYETADYIELILKNPDTAERLLELAEKTINGLSEFPQRIRPVEDPFLAASGIRAIQINHYLAFFLISQEDKLVTVVRFLYAKRNWIRILKHGFPMV